MQHLFANSAPSSKSSALSTNVANAPLPTDALDELWLRMASRYGHAWVSQYGPQPQGFAGAEWRETLCGLAPEQIRDGFDGDVLRGDAWPPSSTLFRTMCFRIPSQAAIEQEVHLLAMCRHADDFARTARNVSRFALLVWDEINSSRFKQSNFKEADKLLKNGFNLAREHVICGGELPEYPQAPAPPPPRIERDPLTPEQIAERKESTRRMTDELNREFGIAK